MWGYAARRDGPSIGVLAPLRARALVLEADGTRMALISLDLGRPPTRASTALIRSRVRKEAGIDLVFLVASHTHHGPVLEIDSWPTPATSYVRSLENRLVDVIVRAGQNLRPARLGIVARDLPVNRNRHSRLPDKIVDPSVLVLRVEDSKGQPIAHAVHFAAHPTSLPATLFQFSPDFPGALADLVEKETRVPCLFLQGAAGDLSTNRQRDESGEAFGQRVGREALTLIQDLRCTRLERPTLRLREEAFRFSCRIDLGNSVIRGALSLAFFPELISFYEREYREGVRPQLAVALLDGRIGFVGVSGELFCGHALALKRRARVEHLFVFGYCNDYQQYLPTIEAASEGGYGTEPHIAPAAVGAGEQIMDRALIHLYQMRGKLREAGEKKAE
jgi:hypothetical protein